MIFVAWFAIAITLVMLGIVIWQPQWFAKLVHTRYYCARCHKDISEVEKFRLGFEANETREERQV